MPDVAIEGLQIYADELEHRMMGRALHYPADKCANCDVRRAVAVLRIVLDTMRKIEAGE